MASQRIQIRQTEIRGRLGEIASLEGDAYNEDIQAEERELQNELTQSEQRLRSAFLSEGDTPAPETDAPDMEQRERIELRSRARLTRYLDAALRGRVIDGAEAELAAACGVGGIPLELFEPAPENRSRENRAATPGVSQPQVNLAPLQPHIFADSIAAMMMVEMPSVQGGSYAHGTIGTPLTAEPKAKGDDIDGTAATFNVTTVTPKRISARLEIRIEDVAATGSNFEQVLRQNLSMAISSQLDNEIINGTGGAGLSGFFNQLNNPATPTDVADFDTFASAHAQLIDGLFAKTLMDVSIIAGAETVGLAARTFQQASNYKGELSAASYAMQNTGGFMASSRIPAPSSDVQRALACRKGKMGLRLSVCPTWGELGIDDIYSGSASGTRSFSLHILVGDLILVQPRAYSELAYQVA